MKRPPPHIPVRLAHAGRHDAFSLIELLVVMAIIAILLGITLPSISGISRGQALQHAGDAVANTLTVARENALAKNRQVNVRFIQATAPNGQTAVLAIQPWIVNDSGPTALTKAVWLPNGAVISQNSTLSPLLVPSGSNTGTMNVGGVTRSYVGFNFLATGAPSVAANTFITVVDQKDAGVTSTPTNFRSVWVNPITGEIRTFAP